MFSEYYYDSYKFLGWVLVILFSFESISVTYKDIEFLFPLRTFDYLFYVLCKDDLFINSGTFSVFLVTTQFITAEIKKF